MPARSELRPGWAVILLVSAASPGGIAVAREGPGADASGASALANADALRLWNAKPAGTWVEALPIGNGRLGAMVFNGAARERIQ